MPGTIQRFGNLHFTCSEENLFRVFLCTSNQRSRLIRYGGTANGQAYTYDANGNLTSNGTNTFIYDVENHLIQVKKSDGTSIATFTYDQDGKRTSMTTSTGTTNFHYNGDKVIYETDSNNNIVADYTWDDQGNPVTMTKGGTTYYYHVNGHGDVTSLTDSSGNIVAQYQYDAWGNIISSTGTMKDANPYRYAGYRYDSSTGLYYLMARYYDPNVGRFITRDSFNGEQDNPLSLNRYAYTNNNPVMLQDPSGYEPVGTFTSTITKGKGRKVTMRFTARFSNSYLIQLNIRVWTGQKFIYKEIEVPGKKSFSGAISWTYSGSGVAIYIPRVTSQAYFIDESPATLFSLPGIVTYF